ncbi:MAG: hypothetical protein ABFQ64_09150 [Campylobacterota bacterium]
MQKTIFSLILFSTLLFSKSAYVQGDDPLQDRYYDRNEEACLDNSSLKRYACYTAGERYIYFNKDEMQKGIKYWEKSCKWKEYGTACYFLAKVYLDEKNTLYYNREKALKALEKGCGLKEENSLVLGCKEGVKSCCKK